MDFHIPVQMVAPLFFSAKQLSHEQEKKEQSISVKILIIQSNNFYPG